MYKLMRLSIAITLMVGIALLAKNNVAGANSAGVYDRVVQPQDRYAPALDKPDPGSVKPPPADVTVCENTTKSVGGAATLEVTDLADGYCLVAFLRNHAFALGRIPDGAGDVLAHITFLRVFHYGQFVRQLPVEDGEAKICYALPPGTQAEIYFLNFYGPRFGDRTGQPSWELLTTTVADGVACAAAQTSGAYALIGK